MTAPYGPTVASLDLAAFRRRLRSAGVGVHIGPFNVRVNASSRSLANPLHDLYRDYPLVTGEAVYHCHVAVNDVWRLGLPPRRAVRFIVDGRAPHEDMPRGQALPVLEWGINLVVALRYHCYLMLHAAALERGGHGLLLPASPGHGKTTLCAALAHRGFRLLSDEFGLIRPCTRSITPVPRPMPLKNESIEVIQRFAPDAHLGPVIPNTRKGTIAHVRPPVEAIARATQLADARFVVFPRWVAGARLRLAELSRAEAFMRLAMNAFNYELLGERGFATVRDLVDTTRCYWLEYSDLEEATTALTSLVDQAG